MTTQPSKPSPKPSRLNRSGAARGKPVARPKPPSSNTSTASITRAVGIQHWDEKAPWPSNAKWPKRALGAAQIRDKTSHKPTPIRANRMGEVLRKMFTLAIEWEWRSDNPAMGFHKRIEQARERFLSPEELARLATVLDAALDQRAASIIRLCMLTGARVGEVRTARFEQFNLDYAIWSKPAATTKLRKIHPVPISQDVAAIIRLRHQAAPRGNPWLFPGETVGQPVKELRRFWLRVQKEADLPDVRIHDLRHTFASLLVSGGASLEMIGKLLTQPIANHPALRPPDGLATARRGRQRRKPAAASTAPCA
jgi:integrase